MPVSCFFCNNDVTTDGGPGFKPTQTLYMCNRCGFISLTREAAVNLEGGGFDRWE